MTDLKTRDSLLKALRRAASRELTREELHKQRVSFVMGSLKSSSELTRDRVEEVLAAHDGRKAS